MDSARAAPNDFGVCGGPRPAPLSPRLFTMRSSFLPARARIAILASALLALGSTFGTAAAQTSLTLERVADGLERPVWLGAPTEDDRLFVIEQAGRMRVIENGNLLPLAALDLVGQVQFQPGSEAGLLGAAFDPNFASNGYVYVRFTEWFQNRNVLARYTIAPWNPNQFDASSRVDLLTWTAPFAFHNAGDIHFGPDGYLYVATGEGTERCESQNGFNFKGKMLRIDVSSVDTTGGYSIPPGNPYVGDPNVLDEIWSLGLRNPWRFSFDRETGEMYIADVGDSNWEEISVLPAGAGGRNLGWPRFEGWTCDAFLNCPTTLPDCAAPLQAPVHTYGHWGSNCSITGGFVYRGCAIPDLQGHYFFADYCSSLVWSFTYSGGVMGPLIDRSSEMFASDGGKAELVSAFGEDADGELYICDHLGEIYRIVPQGVAPVPCSGPPPPTGGSFTATPQTISISAGGTQQWTLDCDVPNTPYWVVGSASGTSPGIQLDGQLLPLNIDSYTVYTLQFPNSGVFNSSQAWLNGEGNATGGVVVSPGILDVSLIGASLHHAFVAFDFQSQKVLHASNAQPLDLVP